VRHACERLPGSGTERGHNGAVCVIRRGPRGALTGVPRIQMILGAAALSAALASCGGEDAAAPEATPAPAAAPASTPAPAGGSATISIKGFAFRPPSITVRRGTRVVWVDGDKSNHTVTFKGRTGDLGNVDPGKRLSARFMESGTFRYVCEYHPGMRGRVVVK